MTLAPPAPVETTEAEPLLAVRDVTRRFGEVVANDAVDFEVRAGEVHALLARTAPARAPS